MNTKILSACVVGLLLTACSGFNLVGVDDKVKRRHVCGGSRSCGMGGITKFIKGDVPLTYAPYHEFVGVIDNHNAPAWMFNTPDLCSAVSIGADDVDVRSASLKTFDINETTTRRIKSDISAKLSQELSEFVKLEAGVDFDSLVEKSLTGKIKLEPVMVSLKDAKYRETKKACQDTGKNLIVRKQAVLVRISGDLQDNIRKNIEANIKSQASPGSKLEDKAPVEAKAELDAQIKRVVDNVVSTQLSEQSYLVGVGFQL